MLRNLNNALLLIAASALSTGLQAQIVYKCGATYSQVPCEGAVGMDVADGRSKEQQIQSRTVVARDSKTAETLEKARLKAETTGTGKSGTAQKVLKPGSTTLEKKHNSAPTTAILDTRTGKKSAKGKEKEPEFFTATATTDKKPKPKER